MRLALLPNFIRGTAQSLLILSDLQGAQKDILLLAKFTQRTNDSVYCMEDNVRAPQLLSISGRQRPASPSLTARRLESHFCVFVCVQKLALRHQGLDNTARNMARNMVDVAEVFLLAVWCLCGVSSTTAYNITTILPSTITEPTFPENTTVETEVAAATSTVAPPTSTSGAPTTLEPSATTESGGFLDDIASSVLESFAPLMEILGIVSSPADLSPVVPENATAVPSNTSTVIPDTTSTDDAPSTTTSLAPNATSPAPVSPTAPVPSTTTSFPFPQLSPLPFSTPEPDNTTNETDTYTTTDPTVTTTASNTDTTVTTTASSTDTTVTTTASSTDTTVTTTASSTDTPVTTTASSTNTTVTTTASSTNTTVTADSEENNLSAEEGPVTVEEQRCPGLSLQQYLRPCRPFNLCRGHADCLTGHACCAADICGRLACVRL